MSAATFRLPDALRDEATAYAANLGISLNALVAVALRDYLDARPRPAAQPSAPVLPPQVAAAQPAAVAAGPASRYQKVGRNDPCPCGSGRKFKVCHGGAG